MHDMSLPYVQGYTGRLGTLYGGSGHIAIEVPRLGVGGLDSPPIFGGIPLYLVPENEDRGFDKWEILVLALHRLVPEIGGRPRDRD